MLIKKSHILPAVLATLILLAIVFRKQDTTLKEKDTHFNLSRENDVDNIEIRNSNTGFSISKSGDKWFAEDNTASNPEIVKEVLEALCYIDIQSPVPNHLHEAYSDSIQKSGTTIRLRSNEKLIYQLSFFTINNKTIAINRKHKPYFIYIKGHGTTLLNTIVKTNILQWHNKVLIGLEPNNIKEIVVSYPQTPQKGFQIDNLEKPILFNSGLAVTENADLEALKDYLSFFSGITYSLIDTLKYTVNPNNLLFMLDIKTDIKKVFHIEGFEMIDKTSKKTNIHKFMGIVNNAIVVELRYIDFDPILVEQEYFLKK